MRFNPFIIAKFERMGKFDNSFPLGKIRAKLFCGRYVVMNGFFKTLLGIVVLFSVFFLGFNLGKDKERRKIPEFQKN